MKKSSEAKMYSEIQKMCQNAPFLSTHQTGLLDPTTVTKQVFLIPRLPPNRSS